MTNEDLKMQGPHYSQYANYRSGSLVPIRRPLPNTPQFSNNSNQGEETRSLVAKQIASGGLR